MLQIICGLFIPYIKHILDKVIFYFLEFFFQNPIDSSIIIVEVYNLTSNPITLIHERSSSLDHHKKHAELCLTIMCIQGFILFQLSNVITNKSYLFAL